MSNVSIDEFDRFTLPIAAPYDDHDAPIFDLIQCRDDGLLPVGIDVKRLFVPGSSDDDETLALTWLERSGLRGRASHAIRQNGWVSKCPAWCVSEHSRVQIVQADAGLEHEAYVQCFDSQGPGEVEVIVSAWEEPAGTECASVEILVHGTGRYSSADARAIAAALLDAADVMDRLDDV